jgi:hypothetical protein
MQLILAGCGQHHDILRGSLSIADSFAGGDLYIPECMTPS